jgi:hypothetical protein
LGRAASSDRLEARVQEALDARHQQAAQPPPVKEWLIPPAVSQDGRDSLGRGLDQTDIAAAVAADARVKEARAAPWQNLERAYRDPHAAHDRLNALIKAEGWRGAAQRIEAEPDFLGRLRGRAGMFASRTAELDRTYAVSAARSLAHSLTRIVEVEERAERDYRADVAAQSARDKVGVPQLSAEAAAVLLAVQAAASREEPGEYSPFVGSRNRPAVAQAWADGQRTPAIAAEIDRFETAARQRLGEAGVAAAFRAASEGGLVTVPGVEREHQLALQQVAHRLVAAHRGRTDHDVERSLEEFREREQQRERLGQTRGLGRGR